MLFVKPRPGPVGAERRNMTPAQRADRTMLAVSGTATTLVTVTQPRMTTITGPRPSRRMPESGARLPCAVTRPGPVGADRTTLTVAEPRMNTITDPRLSRIARRSLRAA